MPESVQHLQILLLVARFAAAWIAVGLVASATDCPCQTIVEAGFALTLPFYTSQREEIIATLEMFQNGDVKNKDDQEALIHTFLVGAYAYAVVQFLYEKP